MIDLIRLGFVAVIAVLWRLGGWNKAKWSGYRDMLVPVILFAHYAFACAWWVGLIVAGLAQTIRIGYGAYDPVHDNKPSFLAKITKDREGSLIRAIYGFITAFCIGVAPAVYQAAHGNKLAMFVFIGYVVGNIILEVALNRLKANDWATELSNGAARGSILLWVR